MKLDLETIKKRALEYIKLYAKHGIGHEPWEKDRVYDLFTIVDDISKRLRFQPLRAFCPLCGWRSPATLPSLSSRLRWMSFISSQISRHMRKEHGVKIKRVFKAPYLNESVYRCEKCGYENAGYLWVLIHYIAEHLL